MSATKRWLEEPMEQGHDVPLSRCAYAEPEDANHADDERDDGEHVGADDRSRDGADPDDVCDLVCYDDDSGDR